MEAMYSFKVLYNGRQICILSACTKYHAIDKAYSKFIGAHPHIKRNLFNAKRV
jgi:hypothetical protein